MIDPGKITALVIVLVGFYFIIKDYRVNKELRFIYNAYAFLAVGLVFAILKDVYSFYNYFFNLFEHSFGIMFAGFLFAAGAYLANKRMMNVIEEGRKARIEKMKKMKEKEVFKK
ncbi:hypothetical protein BEH94_00880 [Candidatus Altiarchaeales archaeon WOR_SM1_SCG]|nr:hypothetical protein BEH94_00880 [Candidatus Altiarchaeales archaeon WOR_SM1_SCG]